jgi:Fe-S cluster assembly iron-binding protein IscA
MLTVTNKAASLLKVAKTAEGAAHDAGIRIRLGRPPQEPGEPFTEIGLALADGPKSGDEEFEQDGLRIFVEDMLVEPLEDRTLDVQEGNDGMRLVFR